MDYISGKGKSRAQCFAIRNGELFDLNGRELEANSYIRELVVSILVCEMDAHVANVMQIIYDV